MLNVSADAIAQARVMIASPPTGLTRDFALFGPDVGAAARIKGC